MDETIQIRCSLVAVGNSNVPAGVTDGLAEKFREATEGKLLLSFVDRGRVEVPGGIQDPSEVSAAELHATIGKVTRNRLSAGPVKEIALVFAPLYKSVKTAFGVMFDRGPSNSPDDPDSNRTGRKIYAQVAREGCAVFPDAMAGARHPRTGEQLLQEIRFTCGHELGHVFNLNHRQSPPNFLYEDANDAGPPADRVVNAAGNNYFGFTAGQKNFLQKIEDKADNPVMPGGVPFGDTGQFSAPEKLVLSRQQRSRHAIKVELSATPASGYFFEPFELQLVVRPPRGPETVTVPNCFDPAFPQFDIWIEDPIGERRRYQALKTYCGPTETVKIGQKNPFLRDISIFWESYGYTFRRAGVHKVSVEIKGFSKEVIRAETKIEIRSVPLGKGEELFGQHRRAMVTTKSELFFRRVMGSRDGLARLREHTDSLKKGLIKACCQNALGRIYDTEMRLGPPSWRGRYADQAERYLESSLDAGTLNRSRVVRAKEGLARIKAWRESR